MIKKKELWKVAIAYGLIFLMIALFSSCHSRKKIERKYELDTAVDASRYKSSFDSLMIKGHWHLRLYDTSKPVQPETGLPPVLADLTDDTELVHTVDTNETDTVTVTHHEVEEEHKEEEEGEETSRASTFWSGMKIGALIAIILLIIGYCKYKK